MCVAAITSELFYKAHLANIVRFLYSSKYKILYTYKLASLSCRKYTQLGEGPFSLGNE